MVVVPLLVSAVFTALMGAGFIFVGRRILVRDVWTGDRPAVAAFAAWWFLFGVQGLVNGGRTLLTALTEPSIKVFMLLFYVEVTLLFLSLAGLIVYLYYLWSGRYLPIALIFGAMAAVAILYIGIIQWHGPAFVVVESFRTNVAFAHPLGDWVRAAMLTGFYGPMAGLALLVGYVGSINTGLQRSRAYHLSAILLLLVLADAVALGPVPLAAGTALAPLARVAAAAAAINAYGRGLPSS